jgi:hypothetical protein
MLKKKLIIIVALMLVSLSLTIFPADEYKWILTRTINGCQIYTSVVSGKEYIAAKATCVIPAGIEIVSEVLRDIPNYPKWMEGCAETRVLKAYDPENDGYIFWYHLAVPIVTDRDMILKCSVRMDIKEGKNVIYTRSTKEIPYNAGKGYVRMPSFTSMWVLEYIDIKNTRATFMIDPDLGKGIPISVANHRISTMPYKSLMKMKKMVRDPQYIDKGNSSKYKVLIKGH